MTSSTDSSSADAVRISVSILVVGAFALLAWKLGLFKPEAAREVSLLTGRAAGIHWIVPVYIIVYAALAAFALPVTPLAYGAGALFGFIRGSIDVWIASMIAAITGYLLARGVWSRPARKLLGRRIEKLAELKKDNVALYSFRMQLMPLVPFGAFNYAAGISKVAMLPFLLGTAVGIIPGTLLATYVGDRFIAGVRGEDKRPFVIAAGITLILFGLSFLPNLIKKKRKT